MVSDLWEGGFFRKAMGWVLREVSKKQPEWTYEFLAEHIHQAAGLTLREGAKYLPPEQRESLMANYQSRTRSAR
ncbi:MAG: DNA alkylation repair protein [Elainellaceae cyanobacterium]